MDWILKTKKAFQTSSWSSFLLNFPCRLDFKSWLQVYLLIHMLNRHLRMKSSLQSLNWFLQTIVLWAYTLTFLKSYWFYWCTQQLFGDRIPLVECSNQSRWFVFCTSLQSKFVYGDDLSYSSSRRATKIYLLKNPNSQLKPAWPGF